MVITIHHQPERPIALESFINVEDAEQRADYATLAEQRELYMLFYDKGPDPSVTKAVANIDNDAARRVLQRAQLLFEAIPEDQFNFDVAKASVMARTTL